MNNKDVILKVFRFGIELVVIFAFSTLLFWTNTTSLDFELGLYSYIGLTFFIILILYVGYSLIEAHISKKRLINRDFSIFLALLKNNSMFITIFFVWWASISFTDYGKWKDSVLDSQNLIESLKCENLNINMQKVKKYKKSIKIKDSPKTRALNSILQRLEKYQEICVNE